MSDGLKSIGASPDFVVKQGWMVSRLGQISKIRSEKNHADLLLLSVFLGRGVIAYSEGGGQVHKPGRDLSVYQVVHPGDFVLNNQQAWRGSVGVSKHHGIISPAYVVLALSDTLSPRFADYLFQSRVMVSQWVTSSKGVGDIQRDIHTPWLKNVKVPLPSAEEQSAIVRYLDWSTGRLERVIRARKKLIALLTEQKQVVIHRAVTCGLDPNVALKPSGIPWVGEIPKHWAILRSKYVFREVDDRSKTGQETRMSMSQKLGLIPSSQIVERRLFSESGVGAKICEQGDLVLNRLKAHLGVFALAPSRGLVSPDYTVLRPALSMNPRYFELLYRTPACRVELRRRAKGIVQGFWRLYSDDFYDIKIPVPPVPEQEEIVNQLDLDLTEVNTALARTEREISLLREYRTRLIADVVTGKLDVRDASRQLSEEAEPVIAIEDAPEIEAEETEE